jgi:ABC-type oligopeptide transport system substrate-binding subunit
MAGYPFIEALPVSIGGRELDLLAFNPRVARELLGRDGIASLELSVKVPARPRSREVALILQRQWHEYLGVRMNLLEVEETAWEQDLTFKRYSHLIEESWSAFCDDPNEFLTFFGRRVSRQPPGRIRDSMTASPQRIESLTRLSG